MVLKVTAFKMNKVPRCDSRFGFAQWGCSSVRPISPTPPLSLIVDAAVSRSHGRTATDSTASPVVSLREQKKSWIYKNRIIVHFDLTRMWGWNFHPKRKRYSCEGGGGG